MPDTARPDFGSGFGSDFDEDEQDSPDSWYGDDDDDGNAGFEEEASGKDGFSSGFGDDDSYDDNDYNGGFGEEDDDEWDF